ncbi:MAG: hypothetical protein R6T96_01070, partial [Longimicrobiales bacterium]
MKAVFGRLVLGILILPSLLLFLAACGESSNGTDLEFAISFPESVSPEAQDGRVILIVSKRGESEPIRKRYAALSNRNILFFG